MKKAAAYARYSSHNQQDLSIEAQLTRIQEYARKHGYSIVEIYKDKAVSGFEGKRPGFEKMIEDAKKGKFEAIIVWEYARFARDRELARRYKNLLQNLGIELISITEHIPDSPEGVIIESLYEGIAEYYSRKLARDSMRGMIQAVQNGYIHGGYPPFGYKYILTKEGKKKYAINEEEKPIVQELFQRASKGEPLSKLARWLNEQGLKTRRGKPFTVDTVRVILKNPKYIGKIIFNNRKRRGKFNPFKDPIIIEKPELAIVDTQTFLKVQNLLHRNQRRPPKRFYLLRGIVFCGVCGSPLIGNSRGDKNGDRYQCGNCKKEGKIYTIGADKLENFILQLLQSLFQVDYKKLTKEINTRIKRRFNSAEIVELKEKITEIEESIKNITRAIEQGIISKTLLNRLVDLEREKENIENKIRDYIAERKNLHLYTEDEVKELLNGLKELFKQNKNIQREFILKIVHQITIDFPKKEIFIETLSNSYRAKYDNRGIYLISPP